MKVKITSFALFLGILFILLLGVIFGNAHSGHMFEGYTDATTVLGDQLQLAQDMADFQNSGGGISGNVAISGNTSSSGGGFSGNNRDKYILKSRVITPICPACPSLVCPSTSVLNGIYDANGNVLTVYDRQGNQITDIYDSNRTPVYHNNAPVSNVINSAGTAVSNTIGTVGNTADNAVSTIGTTFDNTLNTVGGLVGAGVSGAANLVGSGVNGSAGLVSSGVNGAAGLVSSGVNGAVGLVGSSVNGGANLVGNAIGGASNIVGGVANGVENGVNNLQYGGGSSFSNSYSNPYSQYQSSQGTAGNSNGDIQNNVGYMGTGGPPLTTNPNNYQTAQFPNYGATTATSSNFLPVTADFSKFGR